MTTATGFIHGDLVKNKSDNDDGLVFFVLNPERRVEANGFEPYYQVVVQNLSNYNDIRYVNYDYFVNGQWYKVDRTNQL